MKENDIKAYQSIVRQPGIIEQVRSSQHPIVCLFFVLFKFLPILLYLVKDHLFFTPGILFNEFLVILLVVDFWYTKNVAGRALAGLRWWLEENDNGSEALKVQCRVNDEYVGGIGSKVFWFVQVLQVLISMLIAILAVIYFRTFNFVFSLMMLGGSAFNLICFAAASKAKGVRVNILNSRLGPGFQKMLMGGSIISFV